ncbi:MAG: diacylglycerol kinase family lipid kinase [Cytophagales bacterium]|nr:diacylglycerol kinase family lipid kinase [Armatimonadota bacterium]
MTEPIYFIYNPHAGPGVKLTMGADWLWLEAAQSYARVATGREMVLVAAESFDSARKAARDAAARGAEIIIGAGGDGTLRALAEALAGTDSALGIVPRGTVNVLARELNIPLGNVAEAMEICLGGRTRRLDLGRIGDRYFLLMCSVGFDATAVQAMQPAVKDLVGASAYVLSGVATLTAFVPPVFTLYLDGKLWFTGPCFMAVIANSPNYGGDFRFLPDAEMEDGLLDVALFTVPPGGGLALQRGAFLRQLGTAALGRAAADPEVHLLRARQIAIQTLPETPAQVDGDAFGATPLVVEVAPKALKVLVPS